MNTTQTATTPRADYNAIAKKLAQTTGSIISKIADKFNGGDIRLTAISNPNKQKEILDAITALGVDNHKATYETDEAKLEAKYESRALLELYDELRGAYGFQAMLPQGTFRVFGENEVPNNLLGLALAEYAYGSGKPNPETII